LLFYPYIIVKEDKMTHYKTFFALLLTLVSFSGTAIAHLVQKGPNGGQYIHMGQFHVEFFNRGQDLLFMVSDNDEKAIISAGSTATLSILERGKTRKVAVVPADKNIFITKLPTPLAKGAKIVIQGTLQNSETFIARFEVR
jgi:hypothetical protein